MVQLFNKLLFDGILTDRGVSQKRNVYKNLDRTFQKDIILLI